MDVGLVEDGEGPVRVAPEGWAVSSLWAPLSTSMAREVIDLPDEALAFEIVQARVALSRCSDDYLRGWAVALGDLQDAVWEKWHPPMAPTMRVTFGLLVVRAVNAGLLWTPDLGVAS